MSKTFIYILLLWFPRFSAHEYDKELNFCTSVSSMIFSTTEKRMDKWLIIGFEPAVSVLVYDLKNTTVAFAMKILTLNIFTLETDEKKRVYKMIRL